MLRRLSLANLRDSFWFLPTLMAALSGAAAVASTLADQALDRSAVNALAWTWTGSAEGARSVLSTIAGSTMTVAGVVYSITVTALAQTSAHFGPRVLRNFTSDRGNQFVLGTFISTFVFCLMVLRTVQTEVESISASVPYLSVNLGILLAIASIGVLIYFIHHIARALQIEVLLQGIGEEFAESLQRLFPEELGIGAADTAPAIDPGGWEQAAALCAPATGYLQRIDQQRLLSLAERHDLVLRLERRPGEFVDERQPVLRVQSSHAVEDGLRRQLVGCLSVGAHRTPQEDAAYSIQQFVEIAARALSPGVNEVFTALSCMDWLQSSLIAVARRKLPPAARLGDRGQLRVLAQPVQFVDLAAAVFDVLRPYAAQQAGVARSLLQTITRLAPHLRRAEDEQAVREHLRRIAAEAQRLPGEADRRDIAVHEREAQAALDAARSSLTTA
jgi:uncharacterized membrane protein